MNGSRLLAIGILLFVGHGGASAQLIGQQADGTKRICIYRANPVGNDTRERRVGLGEACPAHHPIADENGQVPTTARLISNRVENGRRVCSYEQRGRTWSFTVPVDRQCAITAGMLVENDRDGSAASRLERSTRP